MICIWSTLIEVNAKFWHAHFHVPHPFCSSGISNGQCFTFWRGWGCGRWTAASKGSGQLKTQGTSGNSVDVDFILCSVCVYIWTCMNIYIVFIFVCMFISLGAYCIWVCKFVGHMRFHLPKWLKSWVVVREDDYIKKALCPQRFNEFGATRMCIGVGWCNDDVLDGFLRILETSAVMVVRCL